MAARAGSVLQLDGGRMHATTPDHPALDLGTTNSLTLEAFILVTDETNDATQGVFNKVGAYQLAINFNTNQPDYIFFVFRTCAATSCELSFGGATNLGIGWHHLAVCFENTDGFDTFAIYLDGTRLIFVQNVSIRPGFYNSGGPFLVGNLVNSFRGFIDEVRLSDVVRYSGNSYPTPAALFTVDSATRVLWHFDEPVGATNFADASPFGRTLVATNGAHTVCVSGDCPPLAPRLTIQRTGGMVRLAWPVAAADFTLQQAASLGGGPGSWSSVPDVPTTQNGEQVVTLSLSAPRQFYRLFKP